jgi:DnaA-homolog protein
MPLPTASQLILDIRPDAPPSFDNFFAGPNAEALIAVREHAANQTPEPVLYLWGEAGTGKSHLVQAWCRVAGATSIYPLPEPPQATVVVDDVDRLDAENQIHLFSLINAAREGTGRVLATGPVPPAQLMDLPTLTFRPDLATRLAQGLIFRLHPLSDTDKRAALGMRAESRGLRLPDEVVNYLLIRCRRDLPHLLMLVDQLDTHSLSLKRAVSLPLLKDILRQQTP